MRFLHRVLLLLALLGAAAVHAAAPVAGTSAATLVTSSSATLNGSADPNGAATTGWFRYSGFMSTCNDTSGTRVPASGGTSLGAGTAWVVYDQAIAGLAPATTYYFCAIASNVDGTALGAVQTFTTLARAPTVSTGSATQTTGTTATLNGSSNPGGDETTAWFRYGTASPGTCNDAFGTRAPASGGSSLGSLSSSVAYSQAITGLSAGTTYYVCAIASNSLGTAFGSVVSFTTPLPPTTATSAAASITNASATLNGSANPNGAATTGWLRYSTASPGTCNDSFGTRAPASGGLSLGSGTSSAAYSQAITGLSAGTTYYVCAIASNVTGTAFGSLVSFTTPLPPTTTTSAASSITNASATLNGSANPNRAVTTGYFRYSPSNPGTCNDSFGTRAPASSGASLGSGSSVQAYLQSITGLSAGTTYYVCAIAVNAEGTTFGSVLPFTTADAPATASAAATPVTSSSATLNGASNPNGATTTGWFRYGTASPGTCNDSFGTRVPASGGTSLGAGTAWVGYPQAITGLVPATTYYFCAIGNNAYGTTFGALLSFTTLAAAPTVTTGSATPLTGTTATLNATANPGGGATTGWFRYSTASPGTCNDTFGTRAPATGGASLGAGTSSVAYSQAITGLSGGTTYYVCAVAANAVATAFGSLASFTTPLPPTTTTSAASSITNASAFLNGSANPNRSTTTGWFRYSTASPGTCNDSFGTRAPASGGASLGSGSSVRAYLQSITGLSAGTTYYVCAIAQNAEGTTFGSVLSFTTSDAPATASAAATPVTSSSATLNGSANPNGSEAYGFFRYTDSFNPGACNDSFGTRAPSGSASDSPLGAGRAAVPFSQVITGLRPATTYYFCALGRNAHGTTFGGVLWFTTPAAAPTVTTLNPTGVSGSYAQLQGSASLNGSPTTGWFRYSTANPGSCNDSFGTRVPTSGGDDLGSFLLLTVSYSRGATWLQSGTTYYVCAIAQNSLGKSFGEVVAFTTPSPPTVTTSAASSITNASATLNGSANPNRATTTGWFRYSTASPGTCNDSFGTRAPASGGSSLGSGSSAQAYSQSITGLSAGTTYYVCAIAQNAEGTTFGALTSFTTNDTIPDAFAFIDVTGVARGSVQTSNAIAVTGIDTPASISVSGGSYSIGCTATFGTGASTITNGQTVCVRHTASGSFATAVNTTLTVGGVSDTFSSTTEAGVTLTVAMNGSGGGTIAASGIACPGDCTEQVSAGTMVTLTATASAGSAFASWSGCDSTTSNQCTVTMSSGRTVTATFTALTTYNMVLEGWQRVSPYVVTPASGSGTATYNTFTRQLALNLPYSGLTGTESGAHIHGPAVRGADAGVLHSLSAANPKTDTVTLSASEETMLLAGQLYVNIHTSMHGGGEIRAQIDNAGATVTRALTVTKAGTGTGTVTGTAEPGTVIDCGADCSETVPDRKVVSLTATPAAGSVFSGWSGACSGTGTCNVTLDAARGVTATFALAQSAPVVSLNVSSLDFGGQSMGTTSPAQALAITNTGNATLTVSGISIDNAQFSRTHDCATLAPAASCTVNVAFLPAPVAGGLNSTVPVTGTLTITSNGAGSPNSVSLAGTGELSLVTHYYRAILNRAPDGPGKTFWESEAARLSALGVNINETWYVMAGYFFNSAEYLAANKTNDQFVADLYNTFFNRPPDAGGQGYWVGQIVGGLPREVVLFSFMFSNEFRTFTQGIFGNTAARPEVDMVVDFFRGLLNRLPDTASFNYWLGQLRTAQCAGAGPVYTAVDQISAAFMFNPEYDNRARSNTQFVTDMYYSFLRRGGDVGGVSYWINELNTSARYRNDVRYFGFLNSAEFGARVHAVIAAGCVP